MNFARIRMLSFGKQFKTSLVQIDVRDLMIKASENIPDIMLYPAFIDYFCVCFPPPPSPL